MKLIKPDWMDESDWGETVELAQSMALWIEKHYGQRHEYEPGCISCGCWFLYDGLFKQFSEESQGNAEVPRENQ